MNDAQRQQSARKWLFGKPSRGEWRWAIVVGLLLGLVPPAIFIPFFFGGDGPPGGSFLAVFPVFLLIGSAFCGAFAAAATLMLLRLAQAAFAVIEQIDKEYAKFAQQVGGRFERHRATRTVAFTRDGQDVLLSTFEESAGDGFITYTSLTVPRRWPDDFTCRVSPQGIFASLGKLIGLPDIALGHPAFDDTFVVNANNENRAVQILDRAVQDLLLQLIEWSGQRPFPTWNRGEARDVLLRIDKSTIQLRIRGGLGSPEQVADFTNLAVRIADAIHTGSQP